MAHPEDVEPGNEFLEQEKKKDPVEFAKEYMAFAQKYMDEMKAMKAKAEAADVRAPVAIGIYRRPRLKLILSVQQIENGFVVLRGIEYSPDPVTEYAPDQDRVREVVFRELDTFLAGIQGVQGPGTPPPEAGKGLPGASPGIVRLPGPPPVAGPWKGPWSPRWAAVGRFP